MGELTLRQVCEKEGIPRRAIQGYEKLGLVRASGRNERGYLLYDDAAMERIVEIRQYQRFGFQLREICDLIDAPVAVKKAALECQEKLLLEKRSQLAQDIEQISAIIDSL